MFTTLEVYMGDLHPLQQQPPPPQKSEGRAPDAPVQDSTLRVTAVFKNAVYIQLLYDDMNYANRVKMLSNWENQ